MPPVAMVMVNHVQVKCRIRSLRDRRCGSAFSLHSLSLSFPLASVPFCKGMGLASRPSSGQCTTEARCERLLGAGEGALSEDARSESVEIRGEVMKKKGLGEWAASGSETDCGLSCTDKGREGETAMTTASVEDGRLSWGFTAAA